MHQESQPGSMEEELDVEFTMDLIAVSNLPDQRLASASAQSRAAACSKLIAVRLDNLHLRSMSASVLEQLSACRSLHLQHNWLTSCSALVALPRLTFLAMAHNQLQQVEGLQELTGLLYLDISHNMVQQLGARSLPGSIKYLKLSLCSMDAAR
ncbi:hypothetical protein COO60DRAFT_1463685 [Scenedesmus sp. NREL 46B-D3]|nr:hypothetical protein COO60DRAFT_1463685 [Scenedesmus sp. NREL 46B-D3]